MTASNKKEESRSLPPCYAGHCFDDMYRIEERLQTGSYGIVYRVTDKEHGKEYAAKIINRRGLAYSVEKDIESEVQTMRNLVDVEGIAKLVDYFVNESTFIIVQTLARGGDLFDRICTTHQQYNELETRTAAIKLLQTVRALHARNTVHRDIKPENLLLADANDSASILLADFGFATSLPKEGYLTRRCGTPTFIAPEVWKNERYDYGCDMWSIGAVLYMLVDGLPPFHGRTNQETCRLTCRGRVDFSSPQWESISMDAKELILGLLMVDPSKRLTVNQALQSKWIQSGITDALFRNLDWQPSDLSSQSRTYAII